MISSRRDKNMINQILEFLNKKDKHQQNKPDLLIKDILHELLKITGFKSAKFESNTSSLDQIIKDDIVVGTKDIDKDCIVIPKSFKDKIFNSVGCVEIDANSFHPHKYKKQNISAPEFIMGISIKDATGHPYGFCYLMNDKNIENHEPVKQVLTIASFKIAQHIELFNSKYQYAGCDDYENIIKNSYDIIYRTNLNHILTYITPNIQDLTGYKKEEVLGRHINEITFIGDSEKNRYYEEIEKNGKVKNLEVQFPKKDGTIWWGSVSIYPVKNKLGHTIEFEGLVRDISNLKLSEQRLQILSDATFEGIIVHINGLAVDSNSTFNQMVGYSSDEVVGKNVLEFTAPESRDDVLEHIKNKIESPYEALCLRKDGSTFEVELIGRQLTYLGEKARITVLKDISQQKKAIQELSESQKKLTMYFNQSLEGIFFMETATPILWNDSINKEKTLNEAMELLKVTMINDAMLKQYDAKKEQMIGFTMRDFFGHDLEQGKNALRDLFDNKHIQMETHEKKTDGSEVIIEGDYICILDEKSRIKGIFGAQRDITERYITTEKLIKSERQNKELLNLAPDAFFHGNSRGKLIALNNKAEILTGYSREELLQLNMRDLFSASTLNKVPLRYDQLKEGKTIISEREVLRKDGSSLVVEMNSKQMPDGTYISFFRDISFRKQAEMALKESEEKYKLAFKTSPDAVNINSLNGDYIDVNDGFTKLTGYTKEESIGNSALSLSIWANPNDRDRYVKMLESEGQVINFESDFVCKDGTILTGLVSATIITLNRKKHILSITRDITERKKLQNDLIEAKKKAEESDRLKTDFLNNMSHEIRTPLNAIMGFSRLLGESDLSESIKEKYLGIINTSGNQLLTIISDIIDISQLETGQIKLRYSSTNLNKIIEDLKTQFTEQANKNLQILAYKGLEDEKANIKSDQIRLIQIITNLLVNARKFTQKGKIEFGYSLTEDHQLKFYVKDTGIGISKEQHKKIFERFRQAEGINLPIKSGTGLGLAICKALIDLFNGQIWVESEQGNGAQFYFTIPYLPVDKVDNIVRNELKGLKLPPDLKILFAEDEHANTIYIKDLLSTHNCTLIHAKDGLEAVKKFKDNPGIQLVLTDIKMPELDGYEVTKRIKLINPHVPVIAITAYAMKTEYNNAIEAGCSDCLPKPINKETLINCINRVLKKNDEL